MDPSHLAEDRNKAERESMIAAGLVCWPLINGNDRADELAARGARRRSIPLDTIIHAE